MRVFLVVSLFLSINWVSQSSVNAATLTITADNVSKKFSTEQLQNHKSLETVKVDYDPAYGEGVDIEYNAVPVHVLFKGIEVDPKALIQFKATDGFSAPLPTQKLLNNKAGKSVAYVAVENPNKPWPKMKNGKSAGPFYLIWKNPKLSDIGTENWPFMLAGFDVKKSLEMTYPKIIPASNIKKSDPIYLGMQSFVKNCFACHKMNAQGEGVMGPDLNLPMNPTEYFKKVALKKFIRDPSSVRTWPNRVMYGFTKEMLSDNELDQIVTYLEHMAPRKK